MIKVKNKIVFIVCCLLLVSLLSACFNSNKVYIESEYMVVKDGEEIKVVGFSRYGKSFKELTIDEDIKYFGNKTIKYNWDKINLDATNMLEKIYFPKGIEFYLQENGELFNDIKYVKKIIFQDSNPNNFSVKNNKGSTDDLNNITNNGKIAVPKGSLQNFQEKFKGNFVEANTTFYVDGKIYWSDHLEENANITYLPEQPYKDNNKFLGWSQTEGGSIENNPQYIKYNKQPISLYAVYQK